MVRWPLQMTAAGLQWMTSGMQRMGNGMTGSGSGSGSSSGQSWSGGQQNQNQQSGGSGSWNNWGTGGSSNQNQGQNQSQTSGVQQGSGDQDLSGPDIKYVVWSIVFTKPGYEAVVEPMQSDMVNYSTDGTTFAAMKIAKVLERARHGKAEKPGSWAEHGYPPDMGAAARRSESGGNKAEASSSSSSDKGWRIPTDDQKYVQFLYRVEWRLPKQEPEVTRVERVTVERTSNSGPTNIVV
jgi:hypothetical protein